MRIIGVDPGTLITGFGVIDCEAGKMSLVEYGVIRMKAAWSMPLRLREIYINLLSVIERTAPDEFAIESAFYSKNVQSTLKLGHARGVSILAAVLREIPTSEYAPREVKLAVTGSGAASKERVEYMVMQLLSIAERHAFMDASDALGVAICHANRISRPQSKSGSWKQFIIDNPDRIALTR
ncbi:MAG: crossover junction endodeoxyribonuclease ruvc [Chlorobi bacterium]|nr:crossover junction endodeoxyribonuclease ruvc [Chlorobiota bacterium]